MPPILKASQVGVACAVSHEFDNGIQTMNTRDSECEFLWLLSKMKQRDCGSELGGLEE